MESLRCGSPQDKLDEMVRPLVGVDKTKVFLDHMASGTRVSYWGAWNQWREFCNQRDRGVWIDPREGDHWDGNFLEFLLSHLEVMNRKASTSKTKIAAVRFFHLINGKVDFTAGGNRLKTLVKGWKKERTPMPKDRSTSNFWNG